MQMHKKGRIAVCQGQNRNDILEKQETEDEISLTFPKTDFKKSEFIAGYFFKNISKVNIYQKYIIFL